MQSKASIEWFLGGLLRAGVMAAAFTGVVGAALFLSEHGPEHPSYAVFRGEPIELRSLSGVFRSAAALRGQGIIQLAALVLIATPMARVASAAYGFARSGDRCYTLIACTVLAILLYSLHAT